jgi:hypothetical protein
MFYPRGLTKSPSEECGDVAQRRARCGVLTAARKKLAVWEQRLSFQPTGGARGKAGASALRGAAPGSMLWHMGLFFMVPFCKSADQPPGFAVDVVLEIGQRFFTASAH